MIIGSLRGTVFDRDPTGELIVEASGVGYRVTVTRDVLGRSVVGDDVTLWIHHHITDAAQKLFGFGSREGRDAFEGLRKVHGVGPALALAVMDTHPPERLQQILATDDLAALCEVPGVGKKTAQRLLVELRSVLVVDEAPAGGAGATAGADIGAAGGLSGRLGAEADVRAALVNLGYSAEEVRLALGALPDDPDLDAGTLLKQALRALSGR